MPAHIHPTMVDYSPTEVAAYGLIGLKRSAVYKALDRGVLRFTVDERGHKRVSQAEIERYIKVRRLERPDFLRKPTDPLLLQTWQRERGRMGGHAKAALHSREELAAPLRKGRRVALIREVDPEHKLPPDELERRVQAANEKHLAKARMAKAAKALLAQQYGNEQA